MKKSTLTLVIGLSILPSLAVAQTFPGKMPAQTVLCNNTLVAALGMNCSYIVTPITATDSSAGWFLNDNPPAKISKFGDRVFIGDAAKFVATTPSGNANGDDWYSQFMCNVQGFCGANISSAVLAVETSLTNKFGTLAILGTASTLPCLGANCGVIGVTGIAVNNVAATVGKTYGGWGFYAECNNVVNNTGGCSGAEIDLAIYFDRDALFGNIPANNPFQQGGNNAIQSTCGVSDTAPQYVCDTWLSLQGSSLGSNKYVTGINFMHDTIAVARGPLMGPISAHATVAIALPEAYDIVWYHDVNTISGAIFTGSSGRLNLVSNGPLVINEVPTVSCAAGTINLATVVITNGLMTAGC